MTRLGVFITSTFVALLCFMIVRYVWDWPFLIALVMGATLGFLLNHFGR